MKCLCFSDSHGDYTYMKRALAKSPDAEAVFFLGDGIDDFEYIAGSIYGKALYYVSGNCDRGISLRDTAIRTTDEAYIASKHIVMTHGHLYNAKVTYDDLIALGIMRGADIVLFGHTHQPTERYISPEGEEYMHVFNLLKEKDILPADFVPKPIYLFNPGAISYNSPIGPSYGVMTIDEENMLFSFGVLR